MRNQAKDDEMKTEDYCGVEKEIIEKDPVLQLAWDLSQIIDDGAPIGWWKHKTTAACLLNGYEMKRKGWG